MLFARTSSAAEVLGLQWENNRGTYLARSTGSLSISLVSLIGLVGRYPVSRPTSGNLDALESVNWVRDFLLAVVCRRLAAAVYPHSCLKDAASACAGGKVHLDVANNWTAWQADVAAASGLYRVSSSWVRG